MPSWRIQADVAETMFSWVKMTPIGSAEQLGTNCTKSRETNSRDSFRRRRDEFGFVFTTKVFNVVKPDNLDTETVRFLNQARINILDSDNNFETDLSRVQNIPDIDLIIRHHNPHLTLLDDKGPGVRTQGVIQRNIYHGVAKESLLRNDPFGTVLAVDANIGVDSR